MISGPQPLKSAFDNARAVRKTSFPNGGPVRGAVVFWRETMSMEMTDG